MSIIPITHGLERMRGWKPVIASRKVNCNRQDLWQLIETKPDFFENVDKYVATGIKETEMYRPTKESIGIDFANADWNYIDNIDY